MDIQRNDYVERLYAKSWNGKVKIITGLRRCIPFLCMLPMALNMK